VQHRPVLRVDEDAHIDDNVVGDAVVIHDGADIGQRHMVNGVVVVFGIVGALQVTVIIGVGMSLSCRFACRR